MTRLVEIDPREITVTPVFKIMEIENIPKSETAGHPVFETKEVVEVRFAGSKNYSPVFPVDAFWKREGNTTWTYAERWSEQYRQFKEGSPQEALGTPLEMLRPYNVTPEQLSLCRALKIYSIEALYHLEGPQLKALAMNQNALKDAARSFMASRNSGANAMNEIDALKAKIAELEAERSTVVPVNEMAPEEIEQVIAEANQAYDSLTDAQIKDRIAELNDGKRPQGNPSRPTLINILTELEAA